MSIIPVLKRILAYGGALALAIALISSMIGVIVAGGVGLASALVGTAMTVVFLGITAASMLVATRAASGDLLSLAFFAIVVGAWLLKLVLFVVLMMLLKDQAWIQTQILFFTMIAAVIGTLVVDVIVIARSRPALEPRVDDPAREPRSFEQTDASAVLDSQNRKETT